MWPKHEDGSFRYADEIEITDTWRAMEQLVLKGLVKAIGLSNFNSMQMSEIMRKCSMAPAILHAENNPRFNNEGLRYIRVGFCFSSRKTSLVHLRRELAYTSYMRFLKRRSSNK